MTETDWSAELAIACAACGAPVQAPCRNDQGHLVEYMHIDRVADAAAPLGAAAPETDTEPDPRKDALRCLQCEFRADDSPGGWYDVSAHRSATGHRYEHVRPARKPLTAVDIPPGQGAASLFVASNGDVRYKHADGSTEGALAGLNASDEAIDALLAHLAAALPTVTDD